MTWSLCCTDVGGCPAAFTTTSKDELMQLAGLHLAASHPGWEPDDSHLRGLMAAVREHALVPAPR